VFAALPTGGFERGLIFILIPVLAALIATFFVARHADQLRWEYGTRLSGALSLSLVAALTSAVTVFVVSLAATGSFGPGRFETVGAEPIIFALVVFVEVLVPSFLAALVIARPYSDASERK
jgi:ABC-type amino acid transport system permease subunit